MYSNVQVHAEQQPAQQGQQQPRSLYVFNVEGRRWNAPLLLGLADYFERHYSRVVRRFVDAATLLHLRWLQLLPAPAAGGSATQRCMHQMSTHVPQRSQLMHISGT